MNTSQATSTAPPAVRISLAGEGASTPDLITQAGRHGVKLHTGTATPADCDVVWQLAGATHPAPALTEQPEAGTAQPSVVTLVSGFGPPHRGDGHLPLLRLTHPGVDGSLAELVPAAQGTDTLPVVLAASCQAMGYQTVVLAGSAEGFASRTANALMIEAMALVGEGVSPAIVEANASAAGLREPPLLMLDRLGLKVLDDLLHAELHALSDHHGHHNHHEHHEHHDKHDHDHDHDHHHSTSSQLMPESAVYVLEKMAHGFDRMGAASGYGFYEHEEDGSAQLWDGLAVFARGAKEVPEADIADRLLFRVALEAERCVREGLLARDDADKALVAAGVFPPIEAGVTGWIARLGKAGFDTRAAELAASYGKRFEV